MQAKRKKIKSLYLFPRLQLCFVILQKMVVIKIPLTNIVKAFETIFNLLQTS